MSMMDSIEEEYEDKIEQQQECIKRLIGTLHHERPEKYPDNCEVCKGINGGVRGNENIIKGKVMCDYCHVKAEEPTPAEIEACDSCGKRIDTSSEGILTESGELLCIECQSLKSKQENEK